MMRIPHIGPTLSKRIVEARNNTRIRFPSDLEPILGRGLARRVSAYVELKGKKLTEF
jgi:predicted DNA-binding helix-hairpin-helix protein